MNGVWTDAPNVNGGRRQLRHPPRLMGPPAKRKDFDPAATLLKLPQTSQLCLFKAASCDFSHAAAAANMWLAREPPSDGDCSQRISTLISPTRLQHRGESRQVTPHVLLTPGYSRGFWVRGGERHRLSGTGHVNRAAEVEAMATAAASRGQR